MQDEQIAIGGWHTVAALLSTDRPVFAVHIRDGRRQDAQVERVMALAAARRIPVSRCADQQLQRLLPGVNHQGCVALAAPAVVMAENDLEAILDVTDVPFLLVLDCVQDPHNLGACLRSAAAAGVDAVIVPKNQAAGLTPTVRKVSAGGSERVPLIRVTNLARTLDRLKKYGVWLVGMAGEADTSLYSVNLTGSLAVVVGNEGKGLRRLTATSCDTLAAIALPGGVASLNVSVAAGVCLFEALRQRQA